MCLSHGWGIVATGDATDPDFYARFDAASSCKVAIIALLSTNDAITITELLRASGFTGHIVAMAEFSDEVDRLREAGVDAAHYLHDEMGVGLARTSIEEIDGDGGLRSSAASPQGERPGHRPGSGCIPAGPG